MRVSLLVLALCAISASALIPVSPNEVPQGWAEPEYAKQDSAPEMHRFKQFPVSASSGGFGATAPGTVVPGPWFGSYSTRMDEMGYTVPPYAFDPAAFARLGPYRALTNKYSDGTSYPLNMQKFDHFPYDGNGNYIAAGGGAAAAGGDKADGFIELSTKPISPNEVPQGWAEPEYSSTSTVAEPRFAQRQLPLASSSGGFGATAPGTVIPGPWFGSYSTRMDEMGYTVPPYAFDPAAFARLGPYRALTNKYSDGTSYPLNMQKFDSFPYDGNGNYIAPGGGAAAAGGDKADGFIQLSEVPLSPSAVPQGWSEPAYDA